MLKLIWNCKGTQKNQNNFEEEQTWMTYTFGLKTYYKVAVIQTVQYEDRNTDQLNRVEKSAMLLLDKYAKIIITNLLE